jgi:hypothetical protein
LNSTSQAVSRPADIETVRRRWLMHQSPQRHGAFGRERRPRKSRRMPGRSQRVGRAWQVARIHAAGDAGEAQQPAATRSAAPAIQSVAPMSSAQSGRVWGLDGLSASQASAWVLRAKPTSRAGWVAGKFQRGSRR